MRLKVTLAKLRRERKRAVTIFLIFAFLSLGINLSLGDAVRTLPLLPVLYLAYALLTVLVVRRVMGRLDVINALRA